MKDGFKNVCIELETIRNSSKSNESTPPMWLELNEVSIEKEAYRKKKQISKIWKHLLNAPKKERYEQKYQESDNLINQEIDQISTNSVTDKLREIWSKEISNEEEKSIKRWSEKQKWLESYAENYGKPENPQNQQQKSKNQKQRKPKNFTEQRQRSKTPLRTQWTKNKSQSRCGSEQNRLPNRGTFRNQSETSNRVDPKIINLSNRKLDSDEMKVLNKGLKYTPTPPADTDTLSVDIKEFCRKLRLKNHFGDKESKTADESIQALYRLQKDESIIIKEADKGGALVIMDRIYYRDKIQEQLNDKQYYRELNDNMEKKTKRNINKLISKFPHCTTEKEVDYLTKFEVKTSNFYGLPKIHKSKEVETAVQQQNCAYIEINSPKDLKFRPIVAGPQ
ncbi:unnamed protein product [Mytilus edulis]|uniref:Uncharacterized protein n=1 Tax=Mytilus edulis TaxID=6550 RepID=A0A8S3SMG5_MYTED|nr:unnamed protein product [Mytilus edulis]